jgi:hypothetical protein
MRRFVVIDAEQRTEAWRQARCGRLTASRAKDMLAVTRSSGEAAARRDLRVQLVCERLTGQPQEDGYVNADMRRGSDLEPEAFAAYESLTGNVLQRSGFLAHTEYAIGCSLDGHLDDFAGIVELKVPKSATHLGYLKYGLLPAEHKAQVTHALYVTGADFCDFFSFDPRFPSALQTFHVRVTPKDVDLAAYESAALAFLAEVDREIEAVKKLAMVAA